MNDTRYFDSRYRGPNALETPKLIRSITIDRCSNFTSGGANGNDINLLSQLYKARTNSGTVLSLFVCVPILIVVVLQRSLFHFSFIAYLISNASALMKLFSKSFGLRVWANGSGLHGYMSYILIRLDYPY